MWLTVVSDEEETVNPEILSAKYPIVDWESQILGNVNMEDLHVYKIIRAGGNTSYHKSLSSMLKKFNRQDLVDLHRLVMKRFEDTTPEGYNLLLWRDLKIMCHTPCFHNLDQLRLHLERENLHGVNAKTCLQALRTQFKEFLASKGVNATDPLNQGGQQDFSKTSTRCEPSAYRRD
ncbi:hypothetical protein Tco_0214088 [Tanacetum coccineum]